MSKTDIGDAGRVYLHQLIDYGSPRVRKIARQLLIESQTGLRGVEATLDNMCTDAALNARKWWRPSYSAGYYDALSDAWQVARDVLRAERNTERIEDEADGAAAREGRASGPSEPFDEAFPCADCGHADLQHDDGGCLWPKWDKSGGTTCVCAGYEPFDVEKDAREHYARMIGHDLPIEERRERLRKAASSATDALPPAARPVDPPESQNGAEGRVG